MAYGNLSYGRINKLKNVVYKKFSALTANKKQSEHLKCSLDCIFVK